MRKKWGQARQTVARLLALANLIVLLSIGAFVAFSAYRGYGLVETQARNTAENLSVVLDREVSARIEKIDLALRMMALEIERRFGARAADAATVNQWMDQQRKLLPEIDALRATNAEGHIVYGTSLPAGFAVRVADRRYFQQLRDDANAGLVVDGPVAGRIDPSPTMVFARRLTKPDGSFAGVLFARVSVKRFAQILTLVNLDPRAVMVLRTVDLKLIARYPEPAAASQGQGPLAELRSAIAANPEHGQFVARNTVDDVTRVAVYRRVSVYPMYLVIGLARDDYLAAWRADVRNLAGLGLLALAFSAFSAWTIYRLWLKQLTAANALVQRTAELELSNRELETFSYSVAHDLRAPLRAISGFSSIVADANRDKLDQTALGYLERIRVNGERMGELVDDLLNLTRLSRREITRRDVDLSKLAERTIATLIQLHPQRAVHVGVQPGIHVNADPGTLQVVMDNLIGNAWKFTTTAAAARVEVGAAQQDGATAYFVRDNGAGFDMEYAHKLFAPFQRLHAREEFEGTGIGLSLVKRIITKHGGRVWAEAAPGHGATFYFTLG